MFLCLVQHVACYNVYILKLFTVERRGQPGRASLQIQGKVHWPDNSELVIWTSLCLCSWEKEREKNFFCFFFYKNNFQSSLGWKQTLDDQAEWPVGGSSPNLLPLFIDRKMEARGRGSPCCSSLGMGGAPQVLTTMTMVRYVPCMYPVCERETERETSSAFFHAKGLFFEL